MYGQNLGGVSAATHGENPVFDVPTDVNLPCRLRDW